jgi:hypothetical protein
VRSWILCAAVVALLWGARPCWADFISSNTPPDSAVFSLGTPTFSGPSGQTVNIPVTLVSFTPTTHTTYQAFFVGIDVTASSSSLSTGGTYAAWAFTPSPPVSSWTLVNAITGPTPGEVWYSDQESRLTHGFGATANLLLGTLHVDLSQVMMPHAPTTYTVDITATDPSFITPNDPNGYLTFLYDRDPALGKASTKNQVAISFVNGSETFQAGGGDQGAATPAPPSLVLACLGGVLLLVGRLVRRRPC